MRIVWIVLPAALAAACASPDGPFTAVGNPSMPLYEARPHCRTEAESAVGDGASSSESRAYLRCMARLGWVTQTAPGTAGSGSAGGGGGQSGY